MMDDFYSQLKSRSNGEIARPGRGSGPRSSPQSPAFVGTVFSQIAVPTTTGSFFSVHPMTILGPEVESGIGLLTFDSSATVLVCVTGGRTPVAGDALICRFIENRWVADHLAQVGGLIQIPTCYCNAVPSTLHMTSSDPASDGGIFQNCELTYGPTPPEYERLSLGTKSFLSTTPFVDSSGDSFKYFFGCDYSNFTLSRVYARSVLGSPYHDIVRQTWALELPGNTCQPFLLSRGKTFYGGNPNCVVTMTP